MNRCDCHIHITDLSGKYPLAASHDYAPHEARVEDYRKIAGLLGLDRAVVVQPSTYGYDNSCTRDAIQASGGRWRGIAVIGAGARAADIRALHDAGFRGIRFNLLHAGSADLDALESMAELIAPFDWHVEFAVKPGRLREIAERLVRLPVHVVIDHLARLPPGVKADDAQLQQVLSLLRDGKTWIKIAGLYNVSTAGRPYDDLALLVKALVKARPDRLVWGSNWPHPRRTLGAGENLELLQVLERWDLDAATREAILVTNPAALYDFA